jgi:hypothetical protein
LNFALFIFHCIFFLCASASLRSQLVLSLLSSATPLGQFVSLSPEPVRQSRVWREHEQAEDHRGYARPGRHEHGGAAQNEDYAAYYSQRRADPNPQPSPAPGLFHEQVYSCWRSRGRAVFWQCSDEAVALSVCSVPVRAFFA